MSTFKTEFDGERRPTLPSIHTLNLPLLPRSNEAHVKYGNYYNSKFPPPSYISVNPTHGRRVSTSSSCTTLSRNSSPTPSPSDSEMQSTSSSLPSKFRLVPCSLETADAIILIPDVSKSPAGQNPTTSLTNKGQGQGLLLVGPALQQIRHPKRPLAKCARIHPYRIVRGGSTTTSRRSSVASVTPLSSV